MTVLVFGNFQRSLIEVLVVVGGDAARCAMSCPGRPRPVGVHGCP